MKLFDNKKNFKEIYKQRIAETYGRSIESSDITEKYMVLGTLIRDYVGLNWMESKEKTSERSELLFPLLHLPIQEPHQLFPYSHRPQ